MNGSLARSYALMIKRRRLRLQRGGASPVTAHENITRSSRRCHKALQGIHPRFIKPKGSPGARAYRVRATPVLGPVTTKACILAIFANARLFSLFIGLAHAPHERELSGGSTFNSPPIGDSRPRDGKIAEFWGPIDRLLTESAFRKDDGHFAQLRGHWAF
jgi:hypothetical protein